MAKEVTKKILQTKLAISERAFRTNQNPRLSIKEAIVAINEKFKTQAERRAPSGERIVECRSYRPVEGVLGMYLVGYVPDDKMGIVPQNQEALDLLPAPEGTEFLDGELMALISDEAVIVCRLGLYESALNSYIGFLGQKAGLDKDDSAFIFKNRTDVDKLKLIKDDGVASIRFDGVASEAAIKNTDNGADKSYVQKLMASVWEEIQALTYGGETEREIENLKLEVLLKFDKRSGTTIDQAEIQDVAEHIADGDDGFTITTLSGRTIKPNDVLLNKKVSLKKYGKSVAFEEVFGEMLKYHKELTAPNQV
ncbi:hypothetical protein FB480_103469 [Agrobacterium vitis]|nr:hypothetical protein FB480_103469 [Agrobacterium vitis]